VSMGLALAMHEMDTHPFDEITTSAKRLRVG
jgi:hypothetical protein